MKRLMMISFAISTLVVACGDEEEKQEPPPPPPERCKADNLKAYAEGEVSNDEESASLELSSNDVSGRIFDGGELRIRLGDASPPGTSGDQPLMMRIVDNDDDPEFAVFAERFADTASEADPLELQIADATDYSGLGSDNLTSLSDYDCSIDDEGTICVQVGFDSSGTGTLGNDDEYVYNAAGGTITIEGFSTSDDRFFAHWDIEVGPNLFAFQDESSGEFEGCMWPNYDSRPGQGTNYWALE